MDYLAQYYKNKSETLQEQIVILENAIQTIELNEDGWPQLGRLAGRELFNWIMHGPGESAAKDIWQSFRFFDPSKYEELSGAAKGWLKEMLGEKWQEGVKLVDGRYYVRTKDGMIYRWGQNSDGTWSLKGLPPGTRNPWTGEKIDIYHYTPELKQVKGLVPAGIGGLGIGEFANPDYGWSTGEGQNQGQSQPGIGIFHPGWQYGEPIS